jgi:hypothetical protein
MIADADAEERKAALPSLPAADAYLVRRVHVDGVSIGDLAAIWGEKPSVLAARLYHAIAALPAAA